VSTGVRAEDVRAEFDAYYQACEAVADFARANRPSIPGKPTDLDLLCLRTYARASKGFQAGYKLAYDGYGIQAFILGRTVYEDMLVAHWIDINAARAPAQFARYERLQLFRLDQARQQVELGPITRKEIPSQKEVESLVQEFGAKHSWTKLTIDKLKNAVRSEFPEEGSIRRLLDQVHGVTRRYGNLAVHHSFLSLEAAAPKLPDGRIIGDVGASPLLIPQALWILFFSYLNLVTLYVNEEARIEAGRVWLQHHSVFTAVRPADS
jgi:Family of unknown function (DUF5677)